MTDIAVVGAGPAGLMAAIAAASMGGRVVLFEKNDEAGKKLLITGGGHCNISNTLPLAAWPERFGKRGRFILPAMKAFSLENLQEWFTDRGVPLDLADDRHWYPRSRSARDVRQALLDAATAAGVEWRLGKRIANVVRTADGFHLQESRFDRIVLACGGLSYPSTGSTWDGCRMAGELGHAVNPPLPALVGLRARNAMTDLSGLVFPAARVTTRLRGVGTVTGQGELLLTHGGISGPAVLDMSGAVAAALAEAGEGAIVPVLIEWEQGKDAAYWEETFLKWRRGRGGSPLTALLHEHFPNRFCRALCRLSGLRDDATAATLTGGESRHLLDALSRFRLDVTETEGFNRAIVTRGGVKTGEIDPETLASRRVDGLFLAGEMVDVDGPCGGFNLHWALASGKLAGESAAQGAAG